MPMIRTWCICIYIYFYIYVQYIYIIFVNTHRCCFETVSLWSCFLLSKLWNLCVFMYCNLEALALEYIRSLEVCPDFRLAGALSTSSQSSSKANFRAGGSKFYGCWGSVNLKASPYHTTILNHPAVFHLRTPSSKQIRWTTVINGKDEWLRLGVRWWINDLL